MTPFDNKPNIESFVVAVDERFAIKIVKIEGADK